MMQYSTIAVLGGTGRTGQFLLMQLLQEGYHIKALVRNPPTCLIRHPNLRFVIGDALDYQVIEALLAGTQAVMSTIGQRSGEPLVAAKVTEHLLRAMAFHDIDRYIVLAGLNVDAPTDYKGPDTLQATLWMQQTYPLVHHDRQLSVQLLQSSSLSWTMLRVPYIRFEAGNQAFRIDLMDCPGNYVYAGDIAFQMTQMLSDASYIGEAPFMTSNH
ncbi:NAD(P)-dependent oxidoreductase [Chitinophaga sp. Hz27]|uniref:NAD(P)-dependent oxidoreductase n=1 Tax=Chitinophaga sp. Hz27 TaxID=3347169 RepID=UPI0035DE2319